MNWFAGLEIRILAILADGATEPLKFVYEAGNKRPDLHVQIFDYSRLSIREARTDAISFDLVELASPGCAVRIGKRDLHLQCLRGDNPLFLGPLLVFEDGAPLPCFLPRHPLMSRLRRRKTALLPVLVLGERDEASQIREYERGFVVAERLHKGIVAPGREDSSYFDEEPRTPN